MAAKKNLCTEAPHSIWGVLAFPAQVCGGSICPRRLWPKVVAVQKYREKIILIPENTSSATPAEAPIEHIDPPPISNLFDPPEKEDEPVELPFLHS